MGDDRNLPVNRYLPAETAHRPVGSAPDAGRGTEAPWPAEQDRQLTGADLPAASPAEPSG